MAVRSPRACPDPGRQRYGGIRDFLLGVRFLSSDGAVINSGGKVVKNAAGFDIPKLLVGSLGRLGVMTELTFKVFPRPPATKTLHIPCDSHQTALQRIGRAANSRWELDAIDYVPGDGLFVRLCGPADANDALAAEIKSEWPGEVAEVESSAAESFWRHFGRTSAATGIDVDCQSPDLAAAIPGTSNLDRLA